MATTPKAPKTFKPTLVHAYRRLPVHRHGPNGVVVGADGQPVEEAVEVVFEGKKVYFKSNDAGHIVALVEHEHVFNRLVNEIPEAYIVYAGGDNVPETKIETGPVKPNGVFVLDGGEGEFKVLDDLSNEDLRAFADEAGIEESALPEVLTGDTLRRAIYNLLGGQ